MTEIEWLEIAVILLAMGQIFHLLSHWILTRAAASDPAEGEQHAPQE